MNEKDMAAMYKRGASEEVLPTSYLAPLVRCGFAGLGAARLGIRNRGNKQCQFSSAVADSESDCPRF